jgi:AcrR family transcriptional regulator
MEKDMTSTTKIAINASVKKRLETAIREVFSKGDFHRADMRTIARKAGVSFDTIYKNYGSKEKMLFAFIDEWLNELTDETIRNLEGITNTREKIKIIFSTQLNYYGRHPEMAKIVFMTVPARAWMADESFQQKRMTDIVMKAIREGKEKGLLNPNLRASVMLGAAYGIIRRCTVMWIYNGQKGSLTEQTESVFEVIWNGVSNPDK